MFQLGNGSALLADDAGTDGNSVVSDRVGITGVSSERCGLRFFILIAYDTD